MSESEKQTPKNIRISSVKETPKLKRSSTAKSEKNFKHSNINLEGFKSSKKKLAKSSPMFP